MEEFHYELLCLLNEKEKNKSKLEELISNIENCLGKGSIKKIEEKDWRPAYKIKKMNEGYYMLIYFNSKKEKVEKLKETFLQFVPKEFLNRYKLINLTNMKIRIK
ncbi:30S ribosomal protein S6 [endosymbiont GvMRE of Glomus versiforme]|uniref:30S ribosomal protein S6 n=1 Tax=endosymbiont GvMRE of Glomus versiforme TaxID=2039283 RepID=UPI000EC8D852|nr:30S ribosomal protein S6 [endosymbiont GvMRE of Glomus versiforme]RHZ35225.1 hypothetical protein GvMRE_IIg475 [endosymbiont GvMRE of Glomus versiforme]